MEQLLQHIRTNYEMAKDEELKLTIIAWLHSVSDVIQNLTKDQDSQEKREFKSLRRRIETQSAGSSRTNSSKSVDHDPEV
jgi:hypothetical protein